MKQRWLSQLNLLNAAPGLLIFHGATERLYVALAEKTIALTTPNGEAVHHDVFRDMLTPVDGTVIMLPAVGQSKDYTFNYSVKSTWQPSEMFVTAYLRETATKNIVQSGTRFDPIALDAPQVIENQSVSIFPNPATDEVSVSFGNVIIESVDVFNAAGQKIDLEPEGIGSQKLTLNIGNLPNGIYVTKVKTHAGTAFGKFVKH